MTDLRAVLAELEAAAQRELADALARRETHMRRHSGCSMFTRVCAPGLETIRERDIAYGKLLVLRDARRACEATS